MEDRPPVSFPIFAIRLPLHLPQASSFLPRHSRLKRLQIDTERINSFGTSFAFQGFQLEILIDFGRFPRMIPLPYASHNLCFG